MPRARRKPPKRKPGRPKIEIDDDLVELASALAVNELGRNVEGWFTIPWRDGWNAAALGRFLWRNSWNQPPGGGSVECQIDDILADCVSTRPMISATHYEIAGEALAAAAMFKFTRSTTSIGLVMAALRCVQLKLSNSDGGGHGYNVVLMPHVEAHVARLTGDSHPIARNELELIRSSIMAWRCQDAIGLAPTLMGDGGDRWRRAFKIAWERGLYHAAYSLPKSP